MGTIRTARIITVLVLLTIGALLAAHATMTVQSALAGGTQVLGARTIQPGTQIFATLPTSLSQSRPGSLEVSITGGQDIGIYLYAGGVPVSVTCWTNTSICGTPSGIWQPRVDAGERLYAKIKIGSRVESRWTLIGTDGKVVREWLTIRTYPDTITGVAIRSLKSSTVSLRSVLEVVP